MVHKGSTPQERWLEAYDLPNNLCHIKEKHRSIMQHLSMDCDVVYKLVEYRNQYKNFDIVKPILQKLNVKLLYRLKLNMTTGSAKLHESNLHVDVPDDCKTSVFYVNTNNGYTKFEDGTKIYSKANRLITFNSQMKHCGTNTTDSKYRIVLNINYTN